MHYSFDQKWLPVTFLSRFDTIFQKILHVRFLEDTKIHILQLFESSPANCSGQSVLDDQQRAIWLICNLKGIVIFTSGYSKILH